MCALSSPHELKHKKHSSQPPTPHPELSFSPPFVPHAAAPRVHNTIGVEVERAHLLRDIIQDLEADDTFYETRTMQFRVRENDALHKAFKAVSGGA